MKVNTVETYLSENMDFIAGNFLYGDLPPGKEYLKYYFKGDVEFAFICYYDLFIRLYTDGQMKIFYENFCDHTGLCCSCRWIMKLLHKIKRIENALKDADKDFNISRVAEIKSGKGLF